MRGLNIEISREENGGRGIVKKSVHGKKARWLTVLEASLQVAMRWAWLANQTVRKRRRRGRRRDVFGIHP